MENPHRVLILTSSTGSGHDMRARALAEWMRRVRGDGIDVRIERVIEKGSHIGAFGVGLYNFIHRHMPRAHHLYWHVVEAIVRSHGRKVAFGGRHYRKLLDTFRPNQVWSVHDSTNRGYLDEAKARGGGEITTLTYCGEWSGGYGFSRNWISSAVDHFIARTDETLEYAGHCGLRARKTSVFQRLLPESGLLTPLADDGKRLLRSHLGLDPRKFTLFLGTGAWGADKHERVLDVLRNLGAEFQVIVVCGRNREAYRRLLRWRAENGQLQCHVEGFSRRMGQLMQVSDAVLTRGGSNTSMEALEAGCPLIYNRTGGVMPQESLTIRYFEKHGAAVSTGSVSELQELLRQWLRNRSGWLNVRGNLQRLRRNEHPEEWIQQLVGSR